MRSLEICGSTNAKYTKPQAIECEHPNKLHYIILFTICSPGGSALAYLKVADTTVKRTSAKLLRSAATGARTEIPSPTWPVKCGARFGTTSLLLGGAVCSPQRAGKCWVGGLSWREETMMILSFLIFCCENVLISFVDFLRTSFHVPFIVLSCMCPIAFRVPFICFERTVVGWQDVIWKWKEMKCTCNAARICFWIAFSNEYALGNDP